jgi:dTDP-4-amino-4,6-dideoxygalactose transaminase
MASSTSEGSTSPNSDVPLCDLTQQYRQLQGEIDAAVLRVLASGQVILGPEVLGLEKEFAEYCSVNHAIGCGSGTDALLLALHAMGIGPGDEVILPPFTFFATAGSIHRVGAKPVFADIDPKSFNIDPNAIEQKITAKTRAIMPVHLFGQCAEMDPIRDLAKQYQLGIIEDAAQAIGAEYRGTRTGSLAEISCFSFYPSKNLGTMGDAGMVTTSSPEMAQKMRALRVHGMEPKYYHQYIGWNARIDAIHAAILRVKLPHVDQWTTLRQQAAVRYDELIQSYNLDYLMARPVRLPDRRHVFNQYVVQTHPSQRDDLVRYLKQNGIGCEIYYPRCLHLQESLAFLGHFPGDFPKSEAASEAVLALPMFPEITANQQARVIETCAVYLKQAKRLAA